MSISIKKATINDLERLYRIEKECFTREAFPKKLIESLLRNPRSINLMALVTDEVVGFVIAPIFEYEDKKIGRVFTLDVAVKARRKGIGQLLLRELEGMLRRLGVEFCYLEVRVDNIAARKLYQKLGYIEVESLKDFYYAGGDAVRLTKNLK